MQDVPSCDMDSVLYPGVGSGWLSEGWTGRGGEEYYGWRHLGNTPSGRYRRLKASEDYKPPYWMEI